MTWKLHILVQSPAQTRCRTYSSSPKAVLLLPVHSLYLFHRQALYDFNRYYSILYAYISLLIIFKSISQLIFLYLEKQYERKMFKSPTRIDLRLYFSCISVKCCFTYFVTMFFRWIDHLRGPGGGILRYVLDSGVPCS